MKVVITGGTGFVGRTVAQHLADKGHQVSVIVRSSSPPRDGIQYTSLDLTTVEDFSSVLAGAEAVVHLAGLAHVRRGSAQEHDDAFWPLNVEATRRIAYSAAKMKVRRFVFLSSISVNGEETTRPFLEQDEPRPTSAYARSKLAAEQAIRSMPTLTWTIIRPPLIVGPGAAGNLGLIEKLLRRGVPFPDPRPGNRRSLIGVRNLAAFIEVCLEHPQAANQLFLAADPPPMATADLVRCFGAALGRRARLIPVPSAAVRAGARLIGWDSALGAFWKSLEISTAKAESLLAWKPPFALAEEIANASSQNTKALGAMRRQSKR